MLRAAHAPEYAARGTMLGLVLAFTPTSGLHTTVAVALWVLAARLGRWQFSLILALAWTWVANVFTILPIYYLLYVTGQIMLGRFTDLSGYAAFSDLWGTLHTGDHTLWQDAVLMARMVLEDWGLAMCLGSIPWAALAGALGYRASLKFIHAYRHRRATRRAGAEGPDGRAAESRNQQQGSHR